MLEQQPPGETVELGPDDDDVIDTPDGGAIVRIQEDAPNAMEAREHFANIVEDVESTKLQAIVTDLLDLIEHDKEARSKRDKLYEEGLKRTGLGDDAPGGAQFAGANKVVHPMLVESCVDFAARAMKEIFPPGGPAKAKIFGVKDKEKVDRAERKTEFMNWQTTEDMQEFRGELEQLVTQLPLGGSQYMRFRWDHERERPSSEFVAVDDMLLPFAATNFYTAERRTRVLYFTKQAYERKMRAGAYIEINLTTSQEPEESKALQANNKIEGRQQTGYNEDGLRRLFEVETWLNLEDDDDAAPKPYIITIDDTNRQAVALYRNWDVGDQKFLELEWTAEFNFIPWRGALGIGLTHLIGLLSGAATGALRALLDSAHIQNMPTAIKLKGGPTSQTISLMPTQIVDIEGSPNTDDIRKVVMPLPFNPPSPTLFQLLGFLTEQGKGVVQTTFEKLADVNTAQPVGTTLALIEQGMVVFSSIHGRLHASMARVFKILHRINSAYLTEEIIQERRGEDAQVKPEDFDGPSDVIPVTDPQIFSETQRFAQVQAILQRQAVMPQLYDPRKTEEMFLRSLKIAADDVLMPKPGEDDMDPVSENVAMAMSQPTYVLPQQDHVAHINVHMNFMRSPLYGSNAVFEKKVIMPMTEHIAQHLLNYYLTETHKAVQMGSQEGLLPRDDAKAEAVAIMEVQSYIEKMYGDFSQILPAMDQKAMQYMPKPPQDNTMQVAEINANVQQQALQQRAQDSQQRQQTEMQKTQLTLQDKQAARDAELREVQMREQAEDRRTAQEIEARKSINAADNLTAIEITNTKIAAGESSNLSTGRGINP